MRIVLDLKSIADYQMFLKIKALPIHKFVGTQAEFPDEYADRIGITIKSNKVDKYKASSWLFDYQKDIAAIAIRRRKYACFVDCGLGKTGIALEYSRHALEYMQPNKAMLIVSPLMVINQTIEEAKRFYGNTLPIEKVRSNQLGEWLRSGTNRLGITNYEAITEKISDPGRLGGLILDESSLLKSHYGRWGTRLIELGRGLDWKLCLTGTPAPNDRIEYANHAVFLDQLPTVNSFLARYFINRGETSGRWEMKPHALGAFYRDLSHWCIFLSRPGIYGWKDNADPLPAINTHILNVPLTDQQRTDAMTVSGNLFGVPGGIGSRQKIASIAKDKKGKRPKFIADLVNKEKTPVIVWCKYNNEQDEMAKKLVGCANIAGKTKEDDRVELVRQFQKGERNTLLSKPKILGLGLNFQMCRRMIFSTCQDSYEEYYQAVKRANRYGSKFPLDVYIPVTELERPMLETVLTKAARVQSDTEEQERLFKGAFQC